MLTPSFSDCAALNILMDAADLFPQGWHPLRRDCALDALTQLPAPLSRTDHPVRYYFIDYGLSIRFSAGESHIIHTRGGMPQEKTVPELLVDAPYDAYKVDIYILGCVYRKELYEVMNSSFICCFGTLTRQQCRNLQA